MAKPSARADAFESALKWFQERVPLAERQADALEHRAEKQAFTVAGVTQLRAVDWVMKRLERALAEGTTLADFKAAVGDELREQWQGTVANPSARMETIFRTNIQSAYSAGRVREARAPDTVAIRPYWTFDALLDLRTTDICRKCNGTVLPADSGWFHSHTPPLHFNCRSAIRTLTRDQAQARGITRSPPSAQADEGFGAIEEPHAPSLKGIDSGLREIHQGKVLARRRAKSK